MAGRTYRYFTGKPVYSFGYGLSYTTFAYDDLKVESAEGGVTVTTTVANTGSRRGDEVVQLYLANPRDFTTPIRALKGFERIGLEPGESRTVRFTLASKELSLIDPAGESVPMAGDVTISVGGGQPSDEALAGGRCVQTKIKL
jgi:beta-glucosidase